MTHHPAAFINAIAEEGTKAEAIEWLQKTWNENCELSAQLRALTAAAEVGEVGTDWVSEIDAKAAKLAALHIADTIERCAQVADELARADGMPANKAAAYENAAVHIRALKDKP